MPIMGDILWDLRLAGYIFLHLRISFWILQHALWAFSFPFPSMGFFMCFCCNEDVVKDVEKMDMKWSGTFFACQEAEESKFLKLCSKCWSPVTLPALWQGGEKAGWSLSFQSIHFCNADPIAWCCDCSDDCRFVVVLEGPGSDCSAEYNKVKKKSPGIKMLLKDWGNALLFQVPFPQFIRWFFLLKVYSISEL